MPHPLTFFSLFLATVAAASFSALAIVRIRKGRIPSLLMLTRPSFLLILFTSAPFAFGLILFLQGSFSLILTILLTSLMFTLFYNFLIIPLAIYHKSQEDKPGEPLIYPSLTILVPAYNEEKCIARTVETLLEAYYPEKKEIIVVDDGSTDRTYEIARSYAWRGVKVLHRPNGGKAAALNYGQLFARGEVVVTVDADSIIGRRALVELVKMFQDLRVNAVCGNVKVLNRTNLLTKCQALEYIISINVVRRALDALGTVTVVPGVLGAFRRRVIRGGGLYDKDTLTEDFDITVKTLKQGSVVQASSHALAYTEAPESLGDLIKQRLRWYRGNFQTLSKHKDAFVNPRFGFLHSLSFPFMLLSIVFIPFADFIVIASAILGILEGAVIQVLLFLSFFILVQFLLSVLSIQLDGEDMKLAIYAPLFVLGYKQFCEFLTIKSIFDVLLKRKMEWGRVKRIDLQPTLKVSFKRSSASR